MNNIERTVLAYLVNDPAIAAAAKGYGMEEVGQPTVWPYFTVANTGLSRPKTNSGYGGSSKADLSIRSWALNYADAKDLADKIKAATGGTQGHPADADHAEFDGFRGTMGSLKIEGVFLHDGGERDELVAPEFATSKGTNCRVLDFTIWFQE